MFLERVLCCVVCVVCVSACGDDTDVSQSSDESTTGTTTGSSSGPPPFGELPVFIQPTRVCTDPIEGEPHGMSEGGKVCTWQAIAGATEEGRSFADYADCEVVRTQRPYIPMPSHDAYPHGDARLEDAEYAEELAWVEGQIRSTGCACCHSQSAPQGPVRWTIDAPGNWIGTFSDRDVAALAGLIDTSMFGRFPAQENNGFHRVDSVPSTDPDRIRAFFADELAHRGRTAQDFADAPPTGVPLLEQMEFVPKLCENGEGISPDGILVWSGGPARYIYIMHADTLNPTIPPNLDLPEGTLWRLDVPHTDQPVLPGDVVYGVVPNPMTQKHPAEGQSPQALVSGEVYKIYVTRDVFQPITRCLFVAP